MASPSSWSVIAAATVFPGTPHHVYHVGPAEHDKHGVVCLMDMEVMVDKGDSGHWTDMVAVFWEKLWEMWESAEPFKLLMKTKLIYHNICMSYTTICHRGDCNSVVFRNDFETSFRLKQPTNQRSSPADQEISRH